MPDGLPAPVHLEIPTDLIYVRPVRKMVEGLLVAYGWHEEDVDDAALIITEMVQNGVEHGSRADGSERVHVEVHLHTGAVEFRVTDPGTGEDPKLAMNRDVEVRPPMDEPRGRGLYLIYRLAGAMDRSIAGTGGLCVHARKEATPGEVEAS